MRDRELLLESCEERILCDGVPNVTLQAPANAKLGEQVQVKATFDNTSPTDTGFGPYIDLVIKTTGADGATSAPNDGVTFVGATYLGVAVKSTVLTFDANGQVTHPFAKDASGNPLVVNAPAGYGPGDQLVVLELPFGSFAPDQPPADVNITLQTSNLADVNTPLPISARGGFQFQNDGSNNPTGNSVIDPTYDNAAITPQIFTVTKTYLGPEDETATGPNFPQQYRLDLDVADGQTLTNVDLSDLLPDSMQFVSLTSASPGGSLTSTPSTTTPGGTLTYHFNSVTGTASTSDASVVFEYYVPRIDSGSDVIIPPASGDDQQLDNNATATGTWTPIDPRDPPVTTTVDNPGPEHVLTAKSIATQKSVTIVNDTGAAGLTPGDTLQYTIQVQVSDYFAFQNLLLQDIFSDGQRLDTSFTPTMSWTEHDVTNGASAFASNSYTVTLNADNNPATPATDGSTTLLFNISQEMELRGADGKLLGGGIPDAGTGANPLPNESPLPFGPTTVTIAYRTVVQDKFSDTYPSGDASLNPGDSLGNRENVSGDLLNVTDASTPTGQSETDDSQTNIAIAPSTISKSIYAINGDTNVPANALIKAGDTVTFRLRYTIPSGDAENLVLSDFLPIPLFNASEVTTFSTGAPSATPPPVGTAAWGPLETLRLVAGTPTPMIGISTTDNSLTFTYPTPIDDPTNTQREVDILFTVTVGNDPFLDGRTESNLTQASENGTAGPVNTNTSQDITQFVVQEPTVATGGKGVVGYNNTGLTLGGITFTAPGTASSISGGPVFNATQATAIADSDLLNGEVDAGDTVRYGLVIQNTGGADAYDVQFEDQVISPGFDLPAGATDNDRLNAINLTLFRGDGTQLVRGVDYTATLSTAGLLSIELTDNYTSGNVDAEDGSGGLSRGLIDKTGAAITNGSNTVIATYDLKLSAGVANLGATITNTATLSNYASVEGGVDFANPDLHDSASVKLPEPTLAKTLVGTSVVGADNGNTQAVVGELATYTLTLTLPEGSAPGSTIVDNLDPGYAFVALQGVSTSSGVTFTGSTTPTVSNNGQTLTFNLGTITNANTDNTVPETITITYSVVVLDVNGTPKNNQAGTTLTNSATFSAQYTDLPTGTAQNYSVNLAAPPQNVTVIEPKLQITKGVSNDGSSFSNTLTGVDAGDQVFYQVQITSGAGLPTAYDIFLNDTLPTFLSGLAITSVTATGFSGTAPTAADFTIDASGNLTLAPGSNIDMNGGSTITILVSGILKSSVQPNQSIENDATVRWTSLDGNPGQISTFNTSSTERTGGNLTPAPGVNASDDDSILDNYAATAAATITILNPTPDKTIAATSEASTTVVGGVERVTIGEIVRYRVVWQIPEGTSNNLVITDLLPDGMQFINDGTATLAFVSDGGNISSSIGAIGTQPNVVGSESSLGSITPTFVIPAGQISGGTGNGGDPAFSLGTVSNPDSDGNQEFVVLEFNASVLNVPTNQAFDNSSGAGPTATNLDNSARVQTATSDTTSAPVEVRITEPSITNAQKTVSAGPYDAGDTVTYTVTFGNVTSVDASTAFDVRMTDTLPAFLSGVTLISAVSTGAVTGLTSGVIGNTIGVAADSMAPGATITVTYSGTLISQIPAGQVVTNTASVIYSSLPGSGTAANPTGSSAGAAGTSTGERNGTDGEGSDSAVLNNYADSSTVNLTVTAPTLDKSFQDGTLTDDDTSVASSTGATVVIGEQVTYDILVTLPEGVTPALSINDLVPAGLRVDSIEVLTTTAQSSLLTGNFSGSFDSAPVLSSPFSGPGTLTLDFGNATLPADNITGNNSFVLRLHATVLNVAGNQTGTTLSNTATLTYNRQGTPTTVADSNPANDPTVTVDEPAITTTKTVDDDHPDAGDKVTFTITLTNTSGETAYDLALSDLFPAGFLGATVDTVTSTGTVFVNGVAGTPAANVDVVIVGGSLLRFANSSNIDMAAGATITITGSGFVTGSALPNNTVTNTATTDWTSTNGTNVDERTGADGEGGALNDYESSGSVQVTIPSAEFTKTLFSTSAASTTGSEVTIGETVTYALVVNLPEGITPDLTVTDVLPTGLQFVSSQVVTTAAGSGGLLAEDFGGTVAAPTRTGGASDGDDVTFQFGQITVNGDNDTANNRFIILVTARVLDEPSNVGINPPGQTVLPNTAVFDISTDGKPPFVSSPVVVTVVEPQMVITKSISPSTADAGDKVTVTLTVSNTGTSDAFDVVVNDPLLAGAFSNITPVATPFGFAFTLSGNTVTYANGTIAAGTTATFTFTAVLTGAVTPGEVIDNTASVIQATTLPGTATGERNEPPVSASDDVTVPVGSYSKSLFATSLPDTTGSNVAIGETVTYALKVTLPEGTTNGFNVTDALPAGLQYLSSSILTNVIGSQGLLTRDFNGTVPAPTITGGTGDGDDVTFNFGTINVTGDNVSGNNSFVILVTARVLDVAGNVGTTPGQTTLNNTATFDIPTDGQPPFTPPPVPVTVVEPRLQITKGVSDSTPDPGEILTYTLTIDHTASSTQTAYDILLRDAIPAGMTILTNSITATGANIDSNNSIGSLLDLKFDQLDVGGTITVTYQAQVTTSPTVAGATLDNTAKIYWDTDPAEDPNAVLTGTPDGSPDRDLGAVVPNEPFDQDTDPAQDTERVTVNSNTVTGFVYLDKEPDGVFDNADTGIDGVTVRLTGTDLNGNAVDLTTTTAADGSYSFTGLTPGTYNVIETQPVGYTDALETVGTNFGGSVSSAADSNTISDLTIPAQSNTAGAGYNFGEVLSAGLSGRVYIDANASGARDPGETGIAGVLITLTGVDAANNPVSATTTTTAGGFYFFGDLRPGTYQISEAQPVGFLDGKETVGSLSGVADQAGTDDISEIVVQTGDIGINYDFGETRPSSLSGFVYNDANNDGAFSTGSESPIPGVTVTLSGTDFQGNSVSQTGTTDANGKYLFTDLSPGTYTITETQPSGFLDGKDTPGTPAGSTVGPDSFSNIVLGENVDGANNNFGELVASSVQGNVYVDADNDGTFDASETPLGGVTVDLSGTDDLGNSVTLSTTTGANGDYSFTGLRPGTYTLTETQPSGYLDGQETAGSTGGDVDNTTDSQTISNFDLPSGTTSTGNNFGELLPASLSGTVYLDLNNNGAIDPGENGVPGTTVTLTGVDDRNNPVSTVLTTNGSGGYTFDNLRPGSYTITETQPGGLLDGKDTIGTPGGTAGNDTFSNITVASGTVGTDNNFGELPPSSLSGAIYHDINDNGLYEPGAGETLITTPVTITLTGIDDLGNAVSQTINTTTGTYSFTGLRPGTYTITETTQPAGYLDGTDHIGTQGGSTGNDVLSNIQLSSNTDGTDNNFGELLPSSISGTVFRDNDNDGVLNGTDSGLPLVQMTLTGVDDLGNVVNLTKLTAADGTYSFDNLRPGTYTLAESQPPLFLDGKDTIGTQLGTQFNDRFVFTLPENTNGTGNNFAELPPARISGTVYADYNNNGDQDPGEPGIPGTEVKLTGIDDLGNIVSTSTTTDSNGNFRFGFLRPGEYQLDETQPAGYYDGQDKPGTANGIITGDDRISFIHLDPGQTGADYLFGEIPIPPTPPPPVPPTPVNPTPKPEPPSNFPDFFFDAFHNFAQRVLPAEESGFISLPGIPPLAPIYAGSANLGATLTLDLYDGRGVQLASTTVMVDAGGNWLANFGGVVLRDMPAGIRITQTNSPYSFGGGVGNNLRIYYSPTALNPGQYAWRALETDVSEGPAPLLGGLEFSAPLRLGPVKYNGEILPAGNIATGD